MSHNPVTVEGIIAVQHLQKLLQSGYSSFPVMNSSGNIVGVIPKNFIIVLIENHHWIDVAQLDSYQKSKLPRLFRRSSASDLANDMGPKNLTDDDWFHEENFVGNNGPNSADKRKSQVADVSVDESQLIDEKINRSTMKDSLLKDTLALSGKRGDGFTT